MPLVIQNKKRKQNRSSKAYLESDSSDEEFEGGFLGVIPDIITNIAKFATDNKDTIQSVASTAGKAFDFGKAAVDLGKSSNSLKEIEEIKSALKNKKQYSKELEAHILGNGFGNFKKGT